MISYKTKTVKLEEMESVTCDKCKTTYYVDRNIMDVQEFHHINFIGGYSSVFGDGTEVNVDICQYCLYNMINECIEGE